MPSLPATYAMVTMPGAVPEKFAFTVSEDRLAEKINAMAGQRVVLVYLQHKFIPSECFGETEYFVQDARLLQNDTLPPPLVQQGQLQTPR